MLAIFSGLSANLILQLGLGVTEIALTRESFYSLTSGSKRFARNLGTFFIAVILLWLIISFIRSILFLGFLEYVFIFPLSLLTYTIFDYVMNRFIIKAAQAKRKSVIFDSTLAAAALFIILSIACSFTEAVILSAGFSAGIALAVVIVDEIRLRSVTEAVPRWLRGSPLVLITMGLLSMIFTATALMLYQVLGAK
jgi:electron transport complex protein RnfA